MSTHDLIAKAISQVDVRETPPGSNHTPYTRWYEKNGGGPAYTEKWAWCAIFVSWCHAQIGHPLPVIDTKLGYHYTPSMRNWAISHGKTVPTPQAGSIFCVTSDGRWVDETHTGLVTESLGHGGFRTVEGNLGDRVTRRDRKADRHYLFVSPSLAGGGPGPGDPGRRDNRFRAMPVVAGGARDHTAAGPPLGVDPGRPVLTLQTWLNRCMQAGLRGDGDFGPATEAAVRRLQQFWGLAVDGVAGPHTWSQLDIALDLQRK
jgi:hypothetical protein